MRNKLLTIILSLLLISSIGLIGCGGNDSPPEPTQAAPQTSTPTQQAAAVSQTTTQSSSSGNLWSDMPIYSGATEVQQWNMTMPPADESEYSKAEWRYYQTGDALSTVSDYYKNTMKSKGWEEQMWISSGEINTGMYMKNGENDAAFITVVSEDGKTMIGMWRAKK